MTELPPTSDDSTQPTTTPTRRLWRALAQLRWRRENLDMRKAFAFALLLIVAVAGYLLLDRTTLRGAPPEARYVTAAIERGDIRQTVVTTGTLRPVTTVEVGTQLSGQIAELLADFNDRVSKGQPLARLDQRSYEARLAEAQAATNIAQVSVEVNRAKLERSRIDVLDAEAQMQVLKARIDQAKVEVRLANSALWRMRRLSTQGTASDSQLEQASARRDLAEANLQEAEAVVTAQEHAIAGIKVDVQTAQAELARAEAGVAEKQALQRLAEIDVDRTTITSPVDGVVIGRNFDQGQTVSASLQAPTLFTIAGDLLRMEIYANVDEADIGKVRVGQKALFTVDAYPGSQFPAVIANVRQAPQETGTNESLVTYVVVLSVANPENLLLPGMTAVVRIATYEAESVLKIPMAALYYAPAESNDTGELPPVGSSGGRHATLWQLADNSSQPQAVSVTLGQDDGAYAELLDGDLGDGDHLVVQEIVAKVAPQFFGIQLGF